MDPNSSITTKKHITLNPNPMYCGAPYPRDVSPAVQLGKGGPKEIP